MRVTVSSCSMITGCALAVGSYWRLGTLIAWLGRYLTGFARFFTNWFGEQECPRLPIRGRQEWFPPGVEGVRFFIKGGDGMRRVLRWGDGTGGYTSSIE